MKHVLLAAALIATASTALAAEEGSLLVHTQLGSIQGTLSADGSARRWLGIPYAEPPIGERRWRAPVPHAPWSATLVADRFGSPCAQLGSIYGPPPAGKPWGEDNVEAFGQPVGSEDCLTLNVWRPATDARELPVLVFVHGGGGVAGYSGDPIYEASHLAATANAVVITINMRLGVFASFLHPALQSDDALSNSGNFGLLDVIAALHFVHDNAAAFGGDPNNVTLSGESAGAIMVYLAMASPLAKGLFHKAIVMSGLFGDPPPKDKALAFSGELVAHLLVADKLATTPKEAMKLAAEKGAPWLRQYLLGKPSADILAAIKQHKLKNPGTPGDEVVLPAKLVRAFEAGRYNRVPMLVGTTRDEAKLLAGAFKPTDAERFTIMQTPARAAAAKSVDLIQPWLLPGLGPGLYEVYTGAVTWLLVRGANASVQTLALHAPKIYRYRFDWSAQPEPWRTVYGACHAIDVPFLFGNFSTNLFAPFFTERNRAGREALAQVFMRAIGAFARSGDPNGAHLPLAWPVWTAASPQVLRFDATDSALRLSIH